MIFSLHGVKFTNIYVAEFIFLSEEPALKPGILCVSDRVRVVVPLQPAGPVGGGGEPVHGGAGGAPVSSGDLTPGDGGQGSGHGGASVTHILCRGLMIAHYEAESQYKLQSSD